MGTDTHTIVKVSYKEEHEALVIATWLQNQNDLDFDIEDKTLSWSHDSRNFRFDIDDIRHEFRGTLLEHLNLDWIEQGVAEVSGYTDTTWSNLYDEGWRLVCKWREDPTKAELVAWATDEDETPDADLDWELYSEFVCEVGDEMDSLYYDIYRDEDTGTLHSYEGCYEDGYVPRAKEFGTFLEDWFQRDKEEGKWPREEE